VNSNVPDATNGVRFALRAATADDHRRVDSVFAAFDLAHRDGYARFLAAQARALPALEQALAPVDLWSGWRARTPLLLADLAAISLPAPAPLCRFGGLTGPEAWGTQYVLEGSRLGARLLVRQVGADLPRAFLGDAGVDGGWVTFQRELDGVDTGHGDWMARAVRAAKAAFALFEQGASRELAAA
jgi:heme oxygenase